MSHREKQLEAADKLSLLSLDLAKATIQLREHAENGADVDMSYAIVYNLRKELGYIVASLGHGIPRRYNS